MMTKVEDLYRSVFSDLTVDREEGEELTDFFTEMNPPPDTLVSLRASAFKIGSDFLTDDNDKNVALMKAINAIVHAIEKARMQPKPLENTDAFDEEKVSEFYRSLYSDLSVDREENAELMDFFARENPPPVDKLISTRASAFRVGCEFLTDDKDTNVALLRCVNVVVHAFEQLCLTPRPFVLKMEVPQGETVSSIGLDASLGKAVQHLWDLDANRLKPGEDYFLSVQCGKKPYWKEDSAQDPLFERVDTGQFRTRPTYAAFIALLDNYIAETGVAETVSDVERREIWTFLRAIMETAPMQFCHKYCHANEPDKVPADSEGFLKLLHQIWFQLYRRTRGGRDDSSGFEHVFVGEVKDSQVSGFHNWIQLYLEEQKGALDYLGYIKPRSSGEACTNDDDHILTLQFSWKGIEKSVGTSFIGVSPEFEFALYTMCFLVGGEDNHVTLDTGADVFDLNIRCYRMGHEQIGTSFPEATAHYEE